MTAERNGVTSEGMVVWSGVEDAILVVKKGAVVDFLGILDNGGLVVKYEKRFDDDTGVESLNNEREREMFME